MDTWLELKKKFAEKKLYNFSMIQLSNHLEVIKQFLCLCKNLKSFVYFRKSCLNGFAF
jgi:hypothetical protein